MTSVADRPIIAFTGLAGAGKTTAARVLVARHGFSRTRFAQPLKNMLLGLGLNLDQVDGQLKETPCDLLCGKTPRWAMQSLGTEWGRELIGQTLWTEAWLAAVDQLPTGQGVVLDDCRFPNEVDVIRGFTKNSLIVKVVREGAGAAAAGHVSENDGLPCDGQLNNNGSIEDFQLAVDVVALTMLDRIRRITH